MRPDEVATFFTVAKDVEEDRSIVNRSKRNSAERREGRVQETFPHGCALCDVRLEKSEVLRGSAEDLENFYHQCRVTRKRALSNAVGPLVDVAEVEHTAAWRRFTQVPPLAAMRAVVRGKSAASLGRRAYGSSNALNGTLQKQFSDLDCSDAELARFPRNLEQHVDLLQDKMCREGAPTRVDLNKIGP